ncbi:DUF3916 domain-containing protein [Methylobacterium sp. Leaf118]|uniref:DUF3916 domain-containing protein n=1 Tax=Methylobacterium sp. Leaf118 TaxID=2876562 RepID=UPI001E651CBA|nr:DUF3916 domain-containing protein [Methylobacterium sp. Leaf118]
MSRRLSLAPQMSADTVEHQLRAVEQWARSFEHAFPEIDAPRRHIHWHLPVDQALTDPSTSHDPFPIRTRCAQALIDGAASLSAARPPAKAQMRVAALICRPDLFMSQICLFPDPDYFRHFTVRTHPRQQWSPRPPEHRLSDEFGLRIPPGFVERGFHECMREPDALDASRLVVTYEGEVWMIADADPERV